MSRTREDAKRREVELAVSGMSCGSCAARIQRTLAHQTGVEEAIVNYATARATVRFDPGDISVDDMVAAVDKAGYQLERVGTADTAPATAESDAQAMWLRRVGGAGTRARAVSSL